jgi:hypothetical protein
MTEAQWLAATDPELMLSVIATSVTERQWIRVELGCDHVSKTALDEVAIELSRMMEQYADGSIPRSAVEDAFESAIRGDGKDVSFGPHEAILYFRQSLQLGVATDALCGLVRCVFGNPFRPVAVDPSCRTSTVTALAQQMYDSRDFSPMPILADALQDAGCDNDDILDHCRGDGPHVRGCWVVDLVLGKS